MHDLQQEVNEPKLEDNDFLSEQSIMRAEMNY